MRALDLKTAGAHSTKDGFMSENTGGFLHCQNKYSKSGRCKQTSYSLVHLDRNHLTNNRGYVHGCSLCYMISKGIVEHRLWDCELIIQLDELDDPENFKPVLLVHKDE